MHCLCRKNAEHKIINFCNDVKYKDCNRYEMYCNECLISKFAKANCGCSDKCVNAIIVREFNWENAYSYANSFKFMFRSLEDVEPYEEEPKENIKCVYDDEGESTIDDEIPFPYCVTSVEKLPEGWKIIDIYLMIKYEDKNKYVTRSSNLWSLENEPQEFKLIVKKNGECRIFIESCYFDINKENLVLRKTDPDYIVDIPKFKLLNYKDGKTKGYLEYKEAYIYWLDDFITIDSKKGKKRIYWILKEEKEEKQKTDEK